MGGERSFEKGAIIGFNETGKTYFVIRMAQLIYKQNPDKRIIIVSDSVQDATMAGLYKIRSFEHLAAWKNGGIVHFWDENYYGEFGETALMERVYQFIKAGYIKNGALFIDDATAYMEGGISNSIKKILQSYRHNYLDIYFIFHAIKDVPPTMWRKLTCTYLKKTAEPGKKFNFFETERNLPNATEFYQTYLKLQDIQWGDKPQIYTTYRINNLTPGVIKFDPK